MTDPSAFAFALFNVSTFSNLTQTSAARETFTRFSLKNVLDSGFWKGHRRDCSTMGVLQARGCPEGWGMLTHPVFQSQSQPSWTRASYEVWGGRGRPAQASLLIRTSQRAQLCYLIKAFLLCPPRTSQWFQESNKLKLYLRVHLENDISRKYRELKGQSQVCLSLIRKDYCIL